MSALILDIATFRIDRSPAETAEQRVHDACAHRVTFSVLAQAKARASRAVRGGCRIDDAVRRAVAWALCSIHDEPPSAA